MIKLTHKCLIHIEYILYMGRGYDYEEIIIKSKVYANQKSLETTEKTMH